MENFVLNRESVPLRGSDAFLVFFLTFSKKNIFFAQGYATLVSTNHISCHLEIPHCVEVLNFDQKLKKTCFFVFLNIFFSLFRPRVRTLRDCSAHKISIFWTFFQDVELSKPGRFLFFYQTLWFPRFSHKENGILLSGQLLSIILIFRITNFIETARIRCRLEFRLFVLQILNWSVWKMWRFVKNSMTFSNTMFLI